MNMQRQVIVSNPEALDIDSADVRYQTYQGKGK